MFTPIILRFLSSMELSRISPPCLLDPSVRWCHATRFSPPSSKPNQLRPDNRVCQPLDTVESPPVACESSVHQTAGHTADCQISLKRHENVTWSTKGMSSQVVDTTLVLPLSDPVAVLSPGPNIACQKLLEFLRLPIDCDHTTQWEKDPFSTHCATRRA